MSLHLPTLLFSTIYVFVLVGVLMLYAWRRSAGEQSLGCMASMLLLAAAGTLVISLRGLGIDALSIALGNVLLLLACAMIWLAMRVFVGRKTLWTPAFGGGLLWLVLCFWPYFMATVSLRVATSCVLVMLYAMLAGWELWRARRRLDVSVVPALSLLSVHLAFYAVRLLLDRGDAVNRIWSSLEGHFISWVGLEGLLYAIGIAMITLAMVRERTEVRLQAMANSDPLTGIGNRRAFMERASRALAECERRQYAAAVLLCDLDDFKRLNDTYGHALGDEALSAFADVLVKGLRDRDVCGRIGGEEFACLLPNADPAVAVRVAERIRQTCAELQLGAEVRIAVSVGVACTGLAGYQLKDLLSAADQALYRAKAGGRNRVEQGEVQVQPA